MNRLFYFICCLTLATVLSAVAAADRDKADTVANQPVAAPTAKIKVEVVAGNDEANLDPAEREIRNRLQPVLKKELAFANRVCKLENSQRASLNEAGQEAIKKAAYQYIQAQHNPQPQNFAFNVGRNVTQPNPLKMLQAAFLDTAREKLPAQSFDTLKAEYAKRDEYRKQALIENLLLVLDRKLNLTKEQRTKVADSLSAEWNDSSAPQIQCFLMTDQDMIPRFPDKCVTPYLEPTQKNIWNNMPGKGVQFGFDAFEIDPVLGGVTNDDVSDDDQ